MNTPATIALACFFPPDRGLKGACTTIADLSAYYRAGRAWPSKWLAVHTIMDASMYRHESCGKGAKADRRLYRQRMADIYADVPIWTPTAAELNRMAAADEERFTEGRKHRPFPANLHD